VVADAVDSGTARREFDALQDAARLYPGAELRLLTMTQDGLPARVPPGVVAQPASVWMLAPPA
jgi:hypothetical protein